MEAQEQKRKEKAKIENRIFITSSLESLPAPNDPAGDRVIAYGLEIKSLAG